MQISDEALDRLAAQLLEDVFSDDAAVAAAAEAEIEALFKLSEAHEAASEARAVRAARGRPALTLVKP